MLCCKGYVRDIAVKYGIKVVYEGLATYSAVFRILPAAFHIFKDSSSFSYNIRYLNISEQCSNLNTLHALD